MTISINAKDIYDALEEDGDEDAVLVFLSEMIGMVQSSEIKERLLEDLSDEVEEALPSPEDA